MEGWKHDERFLTAKREGSHWVDLGIACVVGLALAVILGISYQELSNPLEQKSRHPLEAGKG